MTFSDETLMAYADGELDGPQRAAVEQAMRDDPEVAAAVARHRALRTDVAAAFAGILDEPVPARLKKPAAPVVQLDFVRAARAKPAPSQPPAPRRSWAQWGGMAATLVLGVLLGRAGLEGKGETPAIATLSGQLVAQGELAAALDQQVGGAAMTGPARVGVSIRTRDGGYCRGFSYGASAGLACREGEQWHIPVLAERLKEAGGGYRQAGSALPPAVLDAIDDRIDGAPLDAAGEQAARSKGWRAAP